MRFFAVPPTSLLIRVELGAQPLSPGLPREGLRGGAADVRLGPAPGRGGGPVRRGGGGVVGKGRGSEVGSRNNWSRSPGSRRGEGRCG